MLGRFTTASHLTPIHQVSPPAHRCPRQRQRQRVTEGTAMAPWNGPNEAHAASLFRRFMDTNVYGTCMSVKINGKLVTKVRGYTDIFYSVWDADLHGSE